MTTLRENCVRAQLARCLRGHTSWASFWGWCEAAILDAPTASPADRLIWTISGVVDAHVFRGEWPHAEMITYLRRVAHVIPISDSPPLRDTPDYARYEARRARRVRRHEATGTIWRLRESQYVLGAIHGYPDRDPALPLTLEECGTLWRMEASGAYRKDKPPTPAQNAYLSVAHRSIAAKDAADRHFRAVQAAFRAGLPVPAAVLAQCPGLIPDSWRDWPERKGTP